MIKLLRTALDAVVSVLLAAALVIIGAAGLALWAVVATAYAPVVGLCVVVEHFRRRRIR